MKIVIVDYKMGNLKSISSVLNFLGVDEVVVSSNMDELKSADKLILPGVGSFGKAMLEIKARHLDSTLNELVIQKKKPILGICLGMQLLGVSSDEDGLNAGLGFIEGVVTKFDSTLMKVPHVGFNQVKTNTNSRLFEGIDDGADFYFTHSYRMHSNANIHQCECNYHGNFVASFEVENICGVQFHPELSQHNGLRLLKNFISNF